MINPAKYESVLKLNQVNGGPSANTAKSEETASNDIVSAFSKLFEKKGETSIKETIYSDPDVKAAFEKKKQHAEKLNSLVASANAVDDEVDEELKGTGATSSYASALKAARKKSILREISATQAQYDSSLSEMNDLV